MSMSKNGIRIDASSNAELKNYFSTKAAGDPFDFHVSGILVENRNGIITATITDVELPGEEGGESTTATPDAMSPASIEMMRGGMGSGTE